MKAKARPLRASPKKKSDKETKMPPSEGRFYRGAKAKSEVEGLPYKSLPTHLQADSGDEATLAAGYARLGAGDFDVTEDKDGRDLTLQAQAEIDEFV